MPKSTLQLRRGRAENVWTKCRLAVHNWVPIDTYGNFFQSHSPRGQCFGLVVFIHVGQLRPSAEVGSHMDHLYNSMGFGPGHTSLVYSMRLQYVQWH